MKRTNQFIQERDYLASLNEGLILNPLEDIKNALEAPHPSESFIEIFMSRLDKGFKKANKAGKVGDHENYAAWNWVLYGDAHGECGDLVNNLQIVAWYEYYRACLDGTAQFWELIQTEYPEYINLLEYLSKVLLVMGYAKGDPLLITIVNPEEPTTISITIEPKYTS